MEKRKTLIGCLAVIGAQIFYGCSFLFTKSATDVAAPMDLISWRFLVAFAVMSIPVALKLVKVRYRGKKLGKLLRTVLLHPVCYFLCETYGILRTTASESGTIIGSIPIFSIIGATIILRKKPTRQQVVGILITVAGVLITVLTQQLSARFDLWGYLLLFGAVLSYSVYASFVELADEFSGMEITYAMLSVGMVVFTAITAISHAASGTMREFLSLPFTNRDFLIAVLYLGVLSSVAAFFLTNVGLANIGTNRSSTFVGITTAVSVSLGVLVLRERFSAGQLIGVIVIVLGVYFANFAGKKKAEGKTA